MKKLLALALVALVTACSSSGDRTECCQKREPKVRYSYRHDQEPVKTYRTANYYEAGCGEQVRTERVPVEVVYKRTTYRTVYEPKTTSTVDYEKRPYNGECGSTLGTPCNAR